MQGIRGDGEFRVLTVYGQGVLGEIVGSDRQKVHLLREFVRKKGGGWNLDHDSERYSRRIQGCADLLDRAAGSGFRHGRRHGRGRGLSARPAG